MDAMVQGIADVGEDDEGFNDSRVLPSGPVEADDGAEIVMGRRELETIWNE
jgi:hypothetical protein